MRGPPWLVKKLLIKATIFIVILLLLWVITLVAKYSFLAWLFLFIPLMFVYRLMYRKASGTLQGLEGENDIKDEFPKLPPGYTFVRNIETENQGNFDYVILGPTGIWMVEVKSHKGYVTFNGDTLLRYGQPFEKDFLKQTYRESKVLEKMIQEQLHMSIPVQPILVFSNPQAHMKLGQRTYKGVYVIQRSWLMSLITRGNGKYLTIETMKKIVEFLRPFTRTLFTEPITFSPSLK